MPANRPSAALAHISMDAQRTPAIDALRGCAVLCVVLLHIQIHMPQEQSLLGRILPQALFNIVFRSGYYGVIIFSLSPDSSSRARRWNAGDPWMPYPGAPFCCGARRAFIPACCSC